LIKEFYTQSFGLRLAGNETEKIATIDANQTLVANSSAAAKAEKSPLEKQLDFYFTLTTSFFVLGGMFGAFTAKFVLDFFGRKWGIVFHNFFTVIGSILVLSSVHVNSGVCVMLSRVFYGIQGGMSCSKLCTLVFVL
jgi:hypothetical protein